MGHWWGIIYCIRFPVRSCIGFPRVAISQSKTAFTSRVVSSNIRLSILGTVGYQLYNGSDTSIRKVVSLRKYKCSENIHLRSSVLFYSTYISARGQLIKIFDIPKLISTANPQRLRLRWWHCQLAFSRPLLNKSWKPRLEYNFYSTVLEFCRKLVKAGWSRIGAWYSFVGFCISLRSLAWGH